MPHLILELALWTLLAFFIGCIIGCLLRKLFGRARTPPAEGSREGAAESSRNVATESSESVVAEGPPTEAAQPEATSTAATHNALALGGKPSRPRGIAAAREGKPDNLQRISGIGPKNEKTLHRLGFFHFDQIAAWTDEEIAWVDDHLKFNGRIQREEWTRQAKLLAEGNEEEFHQLYGTGGLRNKKGETQSGTRTRKD